MDKPRAIKASPVDTLRMQLLAARAENAQLRKELLDRELAKLQQEQNEIMDRYGVSSTGSVGLVTQPGELYEVGTFFDRRTGEALADPAQQSGEPASENEHAAASA